MRRSLVILVVAALAGAAAVAAAYGPGPAEIMLVLLIGMGAVALLTAHLVAGRRERLGPLRRQFSFAIVVAVAQMLLIALVVAFFMFLSFHDALMMSVVVAFTGVMAVRAAQLMSAGVLRDVETVRDGLSAVGRGARDVDLRTAGHDEIAQLAADANAMVARLDAEEQARGAAEAARRDLIAAVSHDLRTPLTSLRLLAEAVDDDIVDEATRRRYLATMSTHVRALGSLIDDLFELSRLEAGDSGWSLERVRLDELVDETVAAMRPEAEARRVAVLAEVPAGLDAAQANPEKVQRVLFNLIQNAIRHTPADGSVTVRAGTADGVVEIEVTDTGEGITAADRGRVFDPFFRGGREAARTRQGAGLGLAISRAIVEAHGGRIWLADSVAGTSVRFSLPRAGAGGGAGVGAGVGAGA